MRFISRSALGALVAVCATSALAATPSFAAGEKPIVITGSATEITENAAELNGKVDPNGAETKYHFEYGTTTSYGKSTPEVSVGSATGKFLQETQLITSLTAGTTYHFRIVATNSNGTADGSDVVFTTVALGLPEISPAGSTKLPVTFKGSFGTEIFERATGATWEFRSGVISGESTGTKEVSNVVITFEGGVGGDGFACSDGLRTPITTSKLHGKLGYINREKKEVGLLLKPSGTEIMHCDNDVAEIEEIYSGSIIIPVTPVNTSVAELTLTPAYGYTEKEFKKEYKQKPELLEGEKCTSTEESEHVCPHHLYWGDEYEVFSSGLFLSGAMKLEQFKQNGTLIKEEVKA